MAQLGEELLIWSSSLVYLLEVLSQCSLAFSCINKLSQSSFTQFIIEILPCLVNCQQMTGQPSWSRWMLTTRLQS